MQIFAMNRPYRSTLTSAQKRELRDNLNDWLTRPGYTHFVTLATNAEAQSPDRMRRLLKHWDARVKKDLIGSRWQKKPDERMLWRAFPEKLDLTALWLLLLQVLLGQIEAVEAKRCHLMLSNGVRLHWAQLPLSGITDILAIYSRGAIRHALS